MSAAETVLSPQPGGGNLSVVRARANDVLLKIHRLTENVRQLETATALDASATQQQHQDVLNALEVVGVEMRALADASRPALRHWTAHPVLIQSEADANNLPWLLSTNPLPGTESAVDGAAAADVSAAYEATSARIDASTPRWTRCLRVVVHLIPRHPAANVPDLLARDVGSSLYTSTKNKTVMYTSFYFLQGVLRRVLTVRRRRLAARVPYLRGVQFPRRAL